MKWRRYSPTEYPVSKQPFNRRSSWNLSACNWTQCLSLSHTRRLQLGNHFAHNHVEKAHGVPPTFGANPGSTAFYVAGLCAERDLARRHNTGGPGSGRAGRYQTVFRVLNPGAARAGCAVFVMGARPSSIRTRIAHAACPQDPEVVITHNLLVIVRLLFCLLSLLRILEPPKLPTSARREQSSRVSGSSSMSKTRTP